MNKNPRILLTGACGFIGSHTTEALLNSDATVLGVDNLRTGNLNNLHPSKNNPRLAIEIQDVGDEAKLDKLVKSFQPTAIVHLAALVSVQESIENPQENFSLNIANTQAIAESARKHDIPRIVFASSAAVYGTPKTIPIIENHSKRPISPYGAAKWISEQILNQYSIHHSIESIPLRFFNVYGSRQDPTSPYSGVISIFSDKIKKQQTIKVFGNGNQTRDFIHVSDVAAITSKASTIDRISSTPHNVCTGVETSLNSLIKTLSEISGKEVQKIYAEKREGDIDRSLGSTSTLRNFLHKNHFIKLKNGLSRMRNE